MYAITDSASTYRVTNRGWIEQIQLLTTFFRNVTKVMIANTRYLKMMGALCVAMWCSSSGLVRAWQSAVISFLTVLCETCE